MSKRKNARNRYIARLKRLFYAVKAAESRAGDEVVTFSVHQIARSIFLARYEADVHNFYVRRQLPQLAKDLAQTGAIVWPRHARALKMTDIAPDPAEARRRLPIGRRIAGLCVSSRPDGVEFVTWPRTKARQGAGRINEAAHLVREISTHNLLGETAQRILAPTTFHKQQLVAPVQLLLAEPK